MAAAGAATSAAPHPLCRRTVGFHRGMSYCTGGLCCRSRHHHQSCTGCAFRQLVGRREQQLDQYAPSGVAVGERPERISEPGGSVEDGASKAYVIIENKSLLISFAFQRHAGREGIWQSNSAERAMRRHRRAKLLGRRSTALSS